MNKLKKYLYLASYWPKMARMPIIGHTFWANQAETFYGIYRLVIRNCGYDTFLPFLSHLWRENGHGHQTHPKGWPTCWTFSVICYLENVFSKCSGKINHDTESWTS